MLTKTKTVFQERRITNKLADEVTHCGDLDDRLLNMAQMRSADVLLTFRTPEALYPGQSITRDDIVDRALRIQAERSLEAAREKLESDRKKAERAAKRRETASKRRGGTTGTTPVMTPQASPAHLPLEVGNMVSSPIAMWSVTYTLKLRN